MNMKNLLMYVEENHLRMFGVTDPFESLSLATSQRKQVISSVLITIMIN